MSEDRRPVWATGEARAMLGIYAVQVGVIVAAALVFKFLVLG